MTTIIKKGIEKNDLIKFQERLNTIKSYDINNIDKDKQRLLIKEISKLQDELYLLPLEIRNMGLKELGLDKKYEDVQIPVEYTYFEILSELRKVIEQLLLVD